MQASAQLGAARLNLVFGSFDDGITVVILLFVKTAISLPDDLFASAEALSERLGVSRSQLFATALAAFIAQHDRASTTARLNAVYASADRDPVDQGLAAMQSHSLSHDSW